MVRTIRKDEKPEAAYEGQLAWLAKRGSIVVPMDAVVGETECYIASTPCQDPQTKRKGLRHFDVWSRPKPVRPGRTPKFWRDTDAFNAWRLELVQHGWTRPDGSSGRIPDANPDVIAEKLDKAKYHQARKESETGLPERAYEQEVARRIEIVETLTGATIPIYLGQPGVPVVDHTSALIQALSMRVKNGDDANAVLSEYPGLSAEIQIAVRAAKPPTVAVSSTAPKTRGKARK
jgi:hypothetical protein